jgi:hypothetical protein
LFAAEGRWGNRRIEGALFGRNPKKNNDRPALKAKKNRVQVFKRDA